MKRVSSNTLILFVNNFAGAAFGLLIAVVIARAFGERGLGAYSLVLAWTFALGIVGDFGLNTLITREVAQKREQASVYLWQSVAAKLVLSAPLVAALFIAAPFLARDAETVAALAVGALLIPLNALYGSFTAIFRAFERMTPIFVLNVGALAIQFVGIAAIAASHGNIVALISWIGVIQALQMIAAMIYLREEIQFRFRQVPRAILTQMLRAGWPFAFAAIVSAIELRLPILLLGVFQNESAVGAYSAAARFVESAKMLPNAFFGALVPALAALTASSSENVAALFQRMRARLMWFAVVVTFALIAFAQPLLTITFGNDFSRGQIPLAILALSLVPALVNALTIVYLYARGEEHFVNRVLAVALAAQFIVAMPLVLGFGAAGAAMSVLAGDVFLFLALNLRTILRVTQYATRSAISIFRSHASAIAIFFVALTFRLLTIWTLDFDGLYGQDPFAYFDYTRSLTFSLSHLLPPPPFFWSIGYPALAALVSIALPMQFAAHFVSILCGALTAALTFLLTREIVQDSRAGILAGLVVAFAGQLLISSISVMSDAPALFWATLSAFALARFSRVQSRRWLGVCGIALGCAVMTRWAYVLLIPVVLAAVWDGGSNPFSRRKRVAVIVVFIASIAISISPQIALMVYHAQNGALAFAGNFQRAGWSWLNAFQSDIVNTDGHFQYALPVGAFYSMPLAHFTYIVPLLTPFIAIGAWSLRHQRFYLLLLGGWIAVPWLYLIGDAWENWRFPLAFFPPLAILAAIGVTRAYDFVVRDWERRAIATLAMASIVITIIAGPRAAQEFVATQSADRAVAHWMTQQLPPHATVLTFGITETLKHFTPFTVIEIYNETTDSVSAIAESNANVFALVNVKNVETQWRGRAPQINFHALRERRDFRLVGEFGGYSLYAP